MKQVYDTDQVLQELQDNIFVGNTEEGRVITNVISKHIKTYLPDYSSLWIRLIKNENAW